MALSNDEHKKAYHARMQKYKDSYREGQYFDKTGRPEQSRQFFKAGDEHLTRAKDHAAEYFRNTGSPIKETDKAFRKLHDPEHVTESTIMKKSLVESAVELMSQQSDMGHYNTVNESRKVDHEADFHTAWKSHISTLNDSQNATAPAQRNLLSQVSQAHLHLAQLHAAMHYNRHGKPNKVSGNDYDEFISAQKNPLVVKK